MLIRTVFRFWNHNKNWNFWFWNTNKICLIISGLWGEGEDVGARASKAERSLRQQTEGESTEELKNGAGAH